MKKESYEIVIEAYEDMIAICEANYTEAKEQNLRLMEQIDRMAREIAELKIKKKK